MNSRILLMIVSILIALGLAFATVHFIQKTCADAVQAIDQKVQLIEK